MRITDCKIYDTAQRQLLPLRPLRDRQVSIYVCGPTVYGPPHVGNARAMVVFDVLVRVLKLFGEVRYVRNITDVDDKILKRARELQIPPAQLVEKNIVHFEQCMEYLHNLPPTAEPRATGHIADMIRLVQDLESKGYTYRSEGNVLFAVRQFADYGCLSRQREEERLAGARVQSKVSKKNEADFVLWKPAIQGEGWDSPWGYGRPGWHLECSAMANKYLGEQFDIHGGGVDLIFPHHENEIAQSKACYGKVPARHWMHTEMLLFNESKMAKSQGNIISVIDAVTEYGGDTLRLLFLMSHYRKTLSYSGEAMRLAQRKLQDWQKKVAGLPTRQTTLPEAFLAALMNDLDTVAAVRLMDEWANKSPREEWGGKLRAAMELLGLQPEAQVRDPEYYQKLSERNTDSLCRYYCRQALKGLERNDTELGGFWGELATRQDILTRVVIGTQEKSLFQAKFLEPYASKADTLAGLINERRAARRAKDWAVADRLRVQLIQCGLSPQDQPNGTTFWSFDKIS